MVDDKTKLGFFAIGALAVIEILNLLFVGLDGGILTAIVGAIAGIGGYEIGKKS